MMSLEEIIDLMLKEIDEIMYLTTKIKDEEVSEKIVRILENNYDIDID